MNEETMSDTSPSDHAWSQEHIAAYIAGGLDAQEAERLEAHARECVACQAALTAARHLDTGLLELFADTRPDLGLEDRAIHKFRTTSHRPLLAGWVQRATAAAAAIIILGAMGAFAGSLGEGGLPMAGFASRSEAERARIEQGKLEAGESALQHALDDSESMDRSKAETLFKEEGGLQGVRSKKEMADGIVTKDNLGRPNSPAVDSTAITDGTSNGLGFALYGVWGEGGNTTAAFPGRSGATKSHLLRDGGGNAETGEVATGMGMGGGKLEINGVYNGHLFADTYSYATPGRGNGLLGGSYGNPYYQGTSSNSKGPGGFGAPVFRPSDHAPKTVTVTEAVPTQKTSGVAAGGTAPPEQNEPTKAPDPKTGGDTTQKPPVAPEVAPDPAKRVILRSGDIEFEIESFDAAAATVTKLVNAIKGGFVATINSDKLSNGKVKGSITVRVPPEHLDGLVLDLRKELGKGGTLKGLRISSQDVTKQYTDIESRLRGARTMEQRLLQIIKEGKGEIKQLLEAEKELGVWRTRIEEFEGELRYYANLAALSTLTITLTEKEIRAAASLTENERVQAGVEVEDVDKTYQQVLAAVLDAKGRVTKSELKQVSAGQFNATLNFEVAPEASGPIRDRLNQLGRVARLEIDRVMQTEGGTLPTDAKAKRGDTSFLVQLYNLVAVAPRETAILQVAVVDVPTAYQTIRDVIARTNCRVLGAQLNEQDKQNVTGQLDFEVRRVDEAALRTALNNAGEVVAQQVTRAAEGDNVTDAKVLYKTAILAANRLKPREVVALSVEVADVDQSTAVFTSLVKEAKGRQVDGNTSRERNGHVTAKLIYEVPLPAEASLVGQFKSAGVVRSSKSIRDPQATDGKFATARIEVTLANQEDIVAPDSGLWTQVRRGLSYSASVLLTSVTWVVCGLCVVLPFAIIGFAGYRVGRKLIGSPRSDTPLPTTPPPAPPAT
jgi:hypothetical protein